LAIGFGMLTIELGAIEIELIAETLLCGRFAILQYGWEVFRY